MAHLTARRQCNESKKIAITILALIFCLVFTLPVFAASPSWNGNLLSEVDNASIPEDRQLPRLVDDADLLSDTEEAQLLSLLDEISQRQNCDVAIVTVDSLDGKSATEYADDFYDYNGYGMGDRDDGILLLVSMEYRDWAISTYGFGITAFTDSGQSYITSQFLPDLSDGNYYNAFEKFASLCDSFITQARNGSPYDYGRHPKEPVNPLWIPGALLIGAVVAFIVLLIMKSGHKSVRTQRAAAEYICRDSFHVTESNDIYLYEHTTRAAIPQATHSSSGGGSSTHSSSSGRSHGGSSGKF